MSNAIALRATIDELEGHRNRALELFGQAFDVLADAFRYAGKAAPGLQYGLDFNDSAKRALCDGTSRDSFVQIVRRKVDSRVWRHLIDHMGLEALMDRQAREEFTKGLDVDPPEATAANCFATMSSLVQDSALIFRRGLANAFSGLDRRFRSHDGFKIGSRICLRYALREYGGFCERDRATIRDVERVFHILDGKTPPTEYNQGIAALADAASRGSSLRAAAVTVENEYFRLRTFKNRNVHIWFLRDDLVTEVNRLLAEYYGEALGAGPDADHPRTFSNVPGHARNFGEFFSPESVVNRVTEAANIHHGLTVLEPSAGGGALAKAARAAGGAVSCIELQTRHVETLRNAGFLTRCADFLEMSPPATLFDRVVMNPPFDRGRDVDHVTHALKFLKPDGVLVSVMSAGVEFREDAKTQAFRAMVEARRGKFVDLPPGSFAESGTQVNTCLLVIGRPQWYR